MRIAQNGRFRQFDFFYEIRHHTSRKRILQEPRNLTVVFPARCWMVKDHGASTLLNPQGLDQLKLFCSP